MGERPKANPSATSLSRSVAVAITLAAISMGAATMLIVRPILAERRAAVASDQDELALRRFADRVASGEDLESARTGVEERCGCQLREERGPRSLEVGGGHWVAEGSAPAFLTNMELAFAAGVSFVLALFLGLLFSRSVSRRTNALVGRAEALAAGTFADTPEAPGDDELTALDRSLSQMSKTIQERLRGLRAEQDRLETMLDSMSAAVLVTDKLGRIHQWNDALDQMVSGPVEGRTAEEVLGSAELHAAIRESRERPRFTELPLETLAGPGTFDVRIAPLRRGDGMVAVLHDVTRARDAERLRRDFVANASHELRTPLTAIRGFTETLRDGALGRPKEATRFLDIILKHTLRLQALVADLDTLSKAESEGSAMQLERVDVQSLVNDVVAGLTERAKERDVQIVLQPALAESHARANQRALDQVLINLVENAIKYTPKGTTVRVKTEVLAEAEKVVVSVVNPGPAIPPEQLSRVFERFYRVDFGRARSEGGTGLGLAIVKHLCACMDVEVDAESNDDATVFSVRLNQGYS